MSVGLLARIVRRSNAETHSGMDTNQTEMGILDDCARYG